MPRGGSLSPGRYHRDIESVSCGVPILSDPRTTPPPPPGLFAQVRATLDSAKALAIAHLELAKTEASAIGGQIARAAALIGLAVAIMLVAGLLLVIGTALFTAEWLLGSMGWGIVHGVLLFTGIAVAAVLLAVGGEGSRIRSSFALATVIGLVVAGVLGLDAPNRLYTVIGDNVLPAIEPGVRPLLVGTLIGALLGVVGGIVLALRLVTGGARVGGFVGLTILGALVGAFSAITFGPQVGIALGLSVGYAAWTVLMAAGTASAGVDMAALKTRFMPTQTIDTSKETLEWLRRRMPPGIGS